MVSSRVQKEIEQHMRDIKDAKDNGAEEQVIKEKTQELYSYLQKEGIVVA